ncbi:uncharacterized protein [Musca autumnalis]|uniref:uncharacterized protein n=1 Tax=Musca autumnalis TaxID=221902 RepID=UPI003CF45F26
MCSNPVASSSQYPCRPSIRCKLPPCNCEKCLHCRGCPSLTDSETSLEDKTTPRSTCKSQQTNIYAALFDIFGIIAFVIMTALTFWAMVCYYLWHFGVYIYDSGRKVQIIALVLLSLIFLGIVFHAISNRKQLSQDENDIPINLSNSSESLILPQEHPRQKGGAEVSSKQCKHCKKSCAADCSKGSKASNSLCDLCSKYYKDSLSNQKMSLSDSEARQMFQKFKFYSIPSEWKSPPSFVVLLMEYLTSFFGTPSGGIEDQIN